jgi:hypothetical protein
LTTSQLTSYTFTATVTNSGFGTLYNLVVTDTPQGQPAQTFTRPTLAQGASVTFTETFTQVPTANMANPAQNVATAEAALVAGGPKIVHSNTASAACQHLDFDAELTITEQCSTHVQVEGGKVVVVVMLRDSCVMLHRALCLFPVRLTM